jgi:hypothetical protein
VNRASLKNGIKITRIMKKEKHKQIYHKHTIILSGKGNSVSVLSSKVASALRVFKKISTPPVGRVVFFRKNLA